MNIALFPSHVATVALGVLGGMGAMLSITGIFGLAAFSVSKRLREIGIRIALGARRKEVLGPRSVGRKIARNWFCGRIVLGFLATASSLPSSIRLLPAIRWYWRGRLGYVILGLLATWIPAQRVLSVDPVIRSARSEWGPLPSCRVTGKCPRCRLRGQVTRSGRLSGPIQRTTE